MRKKPSHHESEMSILEYIHKNPGSDIREISKGTKIRNSTVRKYTTVLEKYGYIKRPKKSKREYILTDRGFQKLVEYVTESVEDGEKISFAAEIAIYAGNSDIVIPDTGNRVIPSGIDKHSIEALQEHGILEVEEKDPVLGAFVISIPLYQQSSSI